MLIWLRQWLQRNNLLNFFSCLQPDWTYFNTSKMKFQNSYLYVKTWSYLREKFRTFAATWNLPGLLYCITIPVNRVDMYSCPRARHHHRYHSVAQRFVVICFRSFPDCKTCSCWIEFSLRQQKNIRIHWNFFWLLFASGRPGQFRPMHFRVF